MLGWYDCVDDNQLPATTWARQSKNTRRFICIVDGVAFIVLLVRDFGPEQLPDPGDIGRTVAVSEEAIVANAVLAFWQDVDQEPADELCRRQRHGGEAACAFKAVILDLEGDAVLIKADQSAVGYRDPVRVTRQVCQHSLWSCEGFFGIYDPVDLAQWFEEVVEGIPVTEARMIAEEVQFPRIMQLGQALQNEPPVKARQHMHGQEEVLAAGDPLCTICRQAPARHDHVDMGMVGHR